MINEIYPLKNNCNRNDMSQYIARCLANHVIMLLGLTDHVCILFGS